MYLGADTGLLVVIANKIPQALQLWETIRSGENNLVLSTVSVNELLVHFYRRGERVAAESLIKLAKSLKHISIVPVSLNIARLSAGYRHGLGLPTIDSIILATFVNRKCKRIYTNDAHFQTVKEKEIVEVVFINEWIN